MIPLALTVRNFLSYGAESQTLDFRGLHMFCLSGENGHGKSALLDAMTWGLFGRARADTDDELMHHGAGEMQVIFDLELNGAQYRVSRLRQTKGKTRQTHLDLLVAEPGGEWRSLSGNSVRETEREIERLLGMNYQTFINSAFLLQGRADEFTIKPPAERKKVLADVLNLDVYERLAVRARERRQEWQGQAALLEGEIRELERHLTRLDAARAALAEAQARRATADAALPPAQERLNTLSTSWQHLRRLREEAERLEADRTRVAATVREHEAQVATVQARLELARQTLASREEVERDYATLLAQRGFAQDQAARLVTLQPLQRRQRELEHAIERAGGELQREAAEIEGKLKGCIQEAARGLEAESLLDVVLAQLAVLEPAPQCRVEAAQQQAARRETIAALKATNTGLDQTLKQLRARYQTLKDGGACCPICEQPLTPEQREQLHGGMKAEADACKAEQIANAAIIVRHDGEVQAMQRDLARLDHQIKQLDSARQQEAMLREKVRAAECARTQAQTWQQELAAVTARLARDDFAADARRSLACLSAEIMAVGYDEAVHTAAQRAERDLAGAEVRQRRLEEAERIARAAEEGLEGAQRNLAMWREQQTALEERLRAIAGQLAGSETVEAELRTQEALVGRLQADQIAAAADLARAEADVAQLEAYRETRQTRLAFLQAAREQQQTYADLTDAFGRNGVQAMLIDEAIPLIEEEANKLLGAMTDGRLMVSLETQRLTQKQNTVETLEVKISDELGTRNYELYSGGEAFRVDFALRVALSRLLAHRAGARLQTLIIDEGFGSQDAAGRERLQHVLTTVAGDFACIIVITHLEEMKDWFPARIEVVKDSAGSHLRLVAA